MGRVPWCLAGLVLGLPGCGSDDGSEGKAPSTQAAGAPGATGGSTATGGAQSGGAGGASAGSNGSSGANAGGSVSRCEGAFGPSTMVADMGNAVASSLSITGDELELFFVVVGTGSNEHSFRVISRDSKTAAFGAP